MTFILGKIFWLLAAPGNFLVLLLIVGVLQLWLSRRRRGVACIAAAAIGLAAIAVLPIGEWLVLPLENRALAVALAYALCAALARRGGA